MTLANRQSLQARRLLTPKVDRLEERAMMTATSVTHLTLVPAHVLSTEKGNVVKKAEVKVDHAKVHAPVTTKAAVETVAKTQFKAPKIVKLNPFLSNTLSLPKVHKAQGSGPVPGYFSPAQVAGAYGVTTLGLANQGLGQTIGIVDEYNDPNVVSDANTFSTQYGLQNFNVSGGPTLSVVKDTTFGPVPNTPTYFNGGTAIETALDVEWAHAMAPKANILMVFVPADSSLTKSFQELLHGVQYAASHGASVVSLSYGYIEEDSQGGFGLPALYSLNSTYLSSAPVTNVALTVSTGDHSYPGFPATSSSVIAVGGTALTVQTSGTGTSTTYSYGSEKAWGSTPQNPFDGAGGGGPSAFFKAPTFQSGNNVTLGGRYRSVPDVSLVADPSTGVSIYDSIDAVDFGGPWTGVGGTSLASPLFAGIISLAQEKRAEATPAKPLLNSAQIENAIYGIYNNSQLYHTYFHDVTTGSNADLYDGFNGYPAGTGYDLATGVGSPIANKLVTYLAGL